MESFRKCLEQLQCPFNWNIKKIAGEVDIDNLITKLSQKSEQIAGQPWINVLVLLTTSYLYDLKENDSDAKKKLQECIDIFSKCIGEDEFMSKYKKSFQHVICSTKAYRCMYIDSCTEKEIKQIFDEIPPYASLSKEEKVAITGIKANVFGLLSIEGRKHALILAREAAKENPDEPEWSLLIGISLSRIRHYTDDMNITDEELNCIEHAYEKNRSSWNAVYLAQTYVEIAKAANLKPVYKLDGKTRNEKTQSVNEFNRKAYLLYKEAVRENKDKCTHTMVRCAKGLFKLYYLDPQVLGEALDIIKKSLERDPSNVMAHGVASSIYSKLKEYELSLNHAIQAYKLGNYASAHYVFSLKLQLNREINAEEYFSDLLRNKPSDTYQFQTHLFAISYYLFKNYCLTLALKHFLKVADMEIMKRENYKRYDYFWTHKNVDLCHVVYNEVKYSLQNKKYINVKEQNQLEIVYEILRRKYPDVEMLECNENLVEKLKMTFTYRPLRARSNRQVTDKQRTWQN